MTKDTAAEEQGTAEQATDEPSINDPEGDMCLAGSWMNRPTAQRRLETREELGSYCPDNSSG